MESYVLLTVQTFEFYVNTIVNSNQDFLSEWLSGNIDGIGTDGRDIAGYTQCLPVEVLVECLHVLFSHRLCRPATSSYWSFASRLTDRVTASHVTNIMTDDLRRGRYWLLLAVRSAALEFYLVSISSHDQLCRRYYQDGAFMRDVTLLKRIVTAASQLCALVRSHLEPSRISDMRKKVTEEACSSAETNNSLPHLKLKPLVNVSDRIRHSFGKMGGAMADSGETIGRITAPTGPKASVSVDICEAVAEKAATSRNGDDSVKASSLSSDSGVLSPLLLPLHTSLSDAVIVGRCGSEQRLERRRRLPAVALPSGQLRPLTDPPTIRVSWAGTPSETRAASLALHVLGQRGAPEGSEDPPPALSRHGSSMRLDKASGPSKRSDKRLGYSRATMKPAVAAVSGKPLISRRLCFRPSVSMKQGSVANPSSWQKRVQQYVYGELLCATERCPVVNVFTESHEKSQLSKQNMVQYLSSLLDPRFHDLKVCFDCLFQSYSTTYTFRPCHLVIAASCIVLLVSESSVDSALVFEDTVERQWKQRVWQLSDIQTVVVGVCGQTVRWSAADDGYGNWQLQLADSAAASHLVSWLVSVSGVDKSCAPLIETSCSRRMLDSVGERESDVLYSSLAYFCDDECVEVSAQMYSYLFFRTASSDHWLPAHCLLWSGELHLFRPVSGQSESEGYLSAGCRPPQITWPLAGSIIARAADERRQLCLRVPSGSRQLQLLLADDHCCETWLARLQSCHASLRPLSNQGMESRVPVPRRLLLTRSSLHVLDCVDDLCCDRSAPAVETSFSASTRLASVSHVHVHGAAAAVIVELNSFDPLTSCGMWSLYFVSRGEMGRFISCLDHLVQQNSSNVAYHCPPSYRCARAIEAASSRLRLPWKPI